MSTVDFMWEMAATESGRGVVLAGHLNRYVPPQVREFRARLSHDEKRAIPVLSDLRRRPYPLPGEMTASMPIPSPSSRALETRSVPHGSPCFLGVACLRPHTLIPPFSQHTTPGIFFADSTGMSRA
jgi:hypothetical protein